jgi:hypothetical protein
MLFVVFVLPREKRSKGRTSVTVEGLLFGSQFGKGLSDPREVEERVVSESIQSSRRSQDDALGLALKRSQRVTVTSYGNCADKPGGAELFGNVVQVAQEPGIVRFVCRVQGVRGRIVLIGSVASGPDSRGAAQGIDFKSRVIRN